MQKLAFFMSAGILIAASSVASAQSGAKIMTPDQLKWGSGGPGSKGVLTAPLAGDPNGTGWFVLRIKMSPGAKNAPHTHKKTEILDIISGTLNLGLGTSMNASNVHAVHAGSVVVIPAGVPHYSTATQTVVYDVSGMGPSTNIPVKKGKM